jgi:hypothetical protein
MPEWRKIFEADDSDVRATHRGKAVWNLLIEAASAVSDITGFRDQLVSANAHLASNA